MMIYISCAKTMTARSKQQVPFTTTPAFEADARQNAMHMAQFSAEELARMLRINSRLAAENRLRYQDFLSPDNQALPALISYSAPSMQYPSSLDCRITFILPVLGVPISHT